MSQEQINLKPEDVLKRIIRNLADEHVRTLGKNRYRPTRPFWAAIKELTGYGSTHSGYLATSHGFNADTGEAL